MQQKFRCVNKKNQEMKKLLKDRSLRQKSTDRHRQTNWHRDRQRERKTNNENFPL